MNYNLNMREEIFGATLNNIETGKREYITKEEMKNIISKNQFPLDSVANCLGSPPSIKFTPLKNKDINYFSFFDIAFLELTRECNLRCSHCLNNSGLKMTNQLSFEEIKELILELSECGLQELRLTGGEPLLFPHLFDVIKLATDNGIYVSIGTNGTLVTKEIAKKLKESGLKKAVVSIDGNESAHDTIRGNGNYKRALIGLKNLKEVGIRVRINSVIMRQNMEDVISFAKKVNELEIPLFIRRFIESGRGENLEDSGMLTADDYRYVKKQLQSEIEASEYVNGHYLRNNEGIVSRIKLPFEIAGCKAGQRAIAIMPDGEISLCGFLAAQGFPSVGNVRQINNWYDFWDSIQKHDYLNCLIEKLSEYNSLPNVQETYCLAYIQRHIKQKVKK